MELIHIHFDSIDSTNTWAKQHCHTFLNDKLTLVTADGQTAGRGRFKRTWESPPGQNIYASFCFFLEKSRKDIGNIPQLMAMAMAEVLESIGFHPVLKWPNDLMLSSKKMGGILTETTPLSDHICVIIGIGLNINMPEDLLKTIDRPATSLLAETGNNYDREPILRDLQDVFLKKLTVFIDEGFFGFLEDYRRRIESTPSKKIRFNDNKTIWEGTYHSISRDGSLNLVLNSGEIKNFLVGEILF